jgi:hypothetical protein
VPIIHLFSVAQPSRMEEVNDALEYMKNEVWLVTLLLNGTDTSFVLAFDGGV